MDAATRYRSAVMKNQLEEISKTSIILADFEFPEALVQRQWLGYEPVTDSQIVEAEKRLGLNLPEDYKEFLKICNGFHEPSNVEPAFLSINEIDYLEKLNPDLVRIWNEYGTIEIGAELKRSIIVAGLHEEQCFLLIPPGDKNTIWRYWKFASWMAGEHEFADLVSYWLHVLEFNREQVKQKNW